MNTQNIITPSLIEVYNESGKTFVKATKNATINGEAVYNFAVYTLKMVKDDPFALASSAKPTWRRMAKVNGRKMPYTCKDIKEVLKYARLAGCEF